MLTPDGVLSFSPARYENYVSPQLARLLASVGQTVKGVFSHMLVIPGDRVFFLMSDGGLFPDIAARIEQRGIPTRLVERHYLDAMLTSDRQADMRRALAQPAAVNRDFSPVLYYYHLLIGSASSRRGSAFSKERWRWRWASICCDCAPCPW